jgi:hypothetical protein
VASALNGRNALWDFAERLMLRTGGHNRQQVRGHYAAKMFVLCVVRLNVKVKLSLYLTNYHGLNPRGNSFQCP